MLQVRVSGMSCDHCVRAVSAAVRAVPGADGVAVDLDAGLVRVDGTPDAASVRAAIEAEGYEVESIAA